MKEVQYTSEDLRFVTKGNALYVFVLGWPGKQLNIRSLTLAPDPPYPQQFYIIEPEDIRSIKLIGYQGDVKWELTPKGLVVDMPEEPPCQHAYTIKIEWT